MRKSEIISILRESVNREQERINKTTFGDTGWAHGYMCGLKSALYFLGEKQAVEEAENSIRSYRESQKAGRD